MPPFEVAPCVVEDGPAIARNNMYAFWEDKNYALRWTRANRNLEYAISQSSLRWPYNITKDPIHRRQEKVIDVSTGELVGFSNWILPKADTGGEGKDEMTEEEIGKLWPEARGPRVDEETRELLKKNFEESDWVFSRARNTNSSDPPAVTLSANLRGDKRWLILAYLAVHPDSQRQGVAMMLLESGIRAAEKMGLDIFVSSTKSGRRAYEKAGFTLLAEEVKDHSEQGGGEEYTAYFAKFVNK